jgi:hypothetical protein
VQPQVTTDLRLRTHSTFYADTMLAAGGAPMYVSVDGARAWNGVREMVGAIHGDPDETGFLGVEGHVRSKLMPVFPCNINVK